MVRRVLRIALRPPSQPTALDLSAIRTAAVPSEIHSLVEALASDDFPDRIDAMLALTSIAATCTSLQIAITDAAWAASLSSTGRAARGCEL